MCTLTIIPFEGGLRLVISRDELRSRPPALRPGLVELEGGGLAAWPIDSLAGGTWVGVHESGLCLALLNGNPRPYPAMPRSAPCASRGLIIPSLIGAADAPGALARLERLRLECYEPFRLVAADAGDPEGSIRDAVWDRRSLRIAERRPGPVCFVSSGLGDELAAPRIDLFQGWNAGAAWTAAAQDAFHDHQWPDRPEISVRMCREGARTMSVTAVEARPGRAARMHHRDDTGVAEVTIAAPGRASLRAGAGSVRASC